MPGPHGHGRGGFGGPGYLPTSRVWARLRTKDQDMDHHHQDTDQGMDHLRREVDLEAQEDLYVVV